MGSGAPFGDAFPESPSIGLDLDDLTFTMPVLHAKDIDGMVAFAAEAVLATLEAGLVRESLPATIAFMGASAMFEHVVALGTDSLLDVAVLDMMESLGDVDLRAARRALADAVNADDEAARHRHRHTAEVQLRGAYELYRTAGEVTGGRRILARVSDGYAQQVRTRSGKAYIASAAIALILRSQDDVGCRTWAHNARDAFTAYSERTRSAFERLAGDHASAEARYRSTPRVTMVTEHRVAPDLYLGGPSTRPVMTPSTADHDRARSYYERTGAAVRHMAVLDRATRSHRELVAHLLGRER